MSAENQLGKYQPYPDYKDSGVEWLGGIPAHWCSTTIKYGFSVCLGKMLQKDAKNEAEKLKPYLKAQNIQPNGVNISVVEQMWFSLSEIRTLRLEKGDVLVSEGGDVGRSAIWNDELPECYIQNAINRVRPVKGNSSRFFLYWMSFLKGSSYIDVICNKATIAHYTAEKVEVSPLLLPDDNEQRTIAAFLDYETARIDQLIAKQKQLIELLKEKRQAVISHAVTKGLNPNAPMKDSGVEWLGQVPEHWVVTTIRNLTRAGVVELQDGNHGELHPIAAEYVDEGIPFLMANNVRGGEIDLTDCKRITKERADKLRIGFAKSGDMLLTHKGTVGEVAIIPACILEDYWMLTPQVTYYRWSKKQFDSQFFACQFQSKSIQTQLDIIGSKQSTRAYIGLIAQGDLIVAIPPISEQKAIRQELDKHNKRFNSLFNKAKTIISLLQERRTALISAAVTGKIDLRGWQPPKREVTA